MDARTCYHVAQTLLKAAQALEADFATTPHQKRKWTRLTVADLRDDPALAEELFNLVQEAYKPIGGHAKIKSPKDLMAEATFFEVTDLDADQDADAVVLLDKKPAGEKGVGLGHDGSRPAKDATITHQADVLNKPGYYVEVSGAIAHVLLTKFKVPAVLDASAVRRVLQKNIVWVGAHPDGKYQDAPGWYERDIGGHKHLKIMLGEPKS